MGFDVVLPRTAALYLVLGDPERLVYGSRLVGPEDAAAVGDEGLGRTVPLDRRVEHGEVRGEVLGAGRRALARIALEWLSSTEIT